MLVKQEYVNAFLAPAQLVWESELSQPLEFIEAKAVSDGSSPQDVIAVIGVTGQLEGSVLYEFGRDTGLAVASIMMGEPLEEHDDVSISALGEIANMISGNAATNLSKQGLICEITPPRLTNNASGKAVEFPGTQIMAAFTSGLGRFNIRIGLAESA